MRYDRLHECVDTAMSALDLDFVTTTAGVVSISSEKQLEFWITAFASSHIGMSAVRDRLIKGCGTLASRGDLVGRGVKLPSYWPGE